MKESTLRKSHRYLGITLALFLLLQGGSGLLISINELIGPPAEVAGREALDASQGEQSDLSGQRPGNHHQPQQDRHGLLGRIHHNKGAIWSLYRILIGAGLMAMLASGTAIFIKIRSRSKRSGQ